MLEFDTEEQSLQIWADSETHSNTEYWIDEINDGAKLMIVKFDYSGDQMMTEIDFKAVAEAIQYANDQEKLIKATR